MNRCLPLKRNGLQWKKSQKTEKTQKKVQNNFPKTPVFLQKRAYFSLFSEPEFVSCSRCAGWGGRPQPKRG
jgi:hypothetical protein